jgi:hypothetical protein
VFFTLNGSYLGVAFSRVATDLQAHAQGQQQQQVNPNHHHNRLF